MDQLSKSHFLKIVEKYHSGNASREELEFLDAYYLAFGLEAGYTKTLSEKDRILLKNELKNSIKNNIAVNPKGEIKQPKRNVIRWPISTAAVILLCIGLGLYYFPQVDKVSNSISKKITKNEIIPGGNKAVLRLANGEKISLTDADNGTLAEQAGIRIVKTADGQLLITNLSDREQNPYYKNQYNTIETPNGGRYQVRLPDGSNVWLNAASKLTFPSTFISHKSRVVELIGEAYFEIAKVKDQPFIVKTYNQTVEVFGTQFNINSYVNEPDVKTTLLEGSIRVGNKGIDKILKPGQQSVLTSAGLKVENVDIELAVAWKNNQFIFESDDIQYIMRMIARWYNVEVEYVGPIPKNKFGGAVSRFENVSEVLKSLESTGRVKFEIVGRRILVSK